VANHGRLQQLSAHCGLAQQENETEAFQGFKQVQCLVMLALQCQSMSATVPACGLACTAHWAHVGTASPLYLRRSWLSGTPRWPSRTQVGGCRSFDSEWGHSRHHSCGGAYACEQLGMLYCTDHLVRCWVSTCATGECLLTGNSSISAPKGSMYLMGQAEAGSSNALCSTVGQSS
jgi:hypothetical protein